jgi:tRNA A-37 threonylcarbamoyl transferase component Bud32
MNIQYCHSEYRDFILDIKRYFDNSKDILFNKRNIIKIVKINDKKFVVKSFKKPNLLNQYVYKFFRDSKAKRSYINSLKLLKLGVNIPKPIGFTEYSTLFTLQQSYFVSEFYNYDFEIRDVLNNKNFEDREQILKEFVYFSFDLHQKGVYHIDYSPGNVLIKKLENNYEFTIVDLNRLKFVNFTNELRFKNLSRFSTTFYDLKLIANEYAKIANIDVDYANKSLLKYHNRHQAYIKRKKLVKKLKQL